MSTGMTKGYRETTMATRKTPARAVTKPAEQEQETTNFDAFSAFRARAAKLNIAAAGAVEIEPFVLGPDQGFDPPISVGFPKTLEKQYVLERCLRAQDHFGALEVLTGDQMLRIVRTFSAQEDGHLLLVGLVYMVMDHFLGRGGSEVPGGSSPS